MKDNTLIPINTPEEELEKKLFEETDLDNMKNIISLFNLNIKKKDIIRTAKLNDLQDKVYNQIDKRLTSKADEFSNADLLNYFKTIQETINKADTSLDAVDTPSIQIIQNQLNVVNTQEEDKLSRESREKISAVVQQVLKNLKNSQVVDAEVTEVKDADEELYEQLTMNFTDEGIIIK